MKTITRRAAIIEARIEADSLIEQLTRLDKGYDKGMYRDDSVGRFWTVKQGIQMSVARAFELSCMFATAEPQTSISLQDALIELEKRKMAIARADMRKAKGRHYLFPDYEYTQAYDRVKRLKNGAFDLYEKV